MRLIILTSAIALWATAHAVSDASPFILASTSSFSKPPNADQLRTSSEVWKTTKDFLSSCPTERYLLTSQPNLSSNDLQSPEVSPNLFQAISNERIQGLYSVRGVYGEVSLDDLAAYIRQACEKANKVVKVEERKAAPLPRTDKAHQLAKNDHHLGEALESLRSDHSYTIIYLSNPSEPAYEADFGPIHKELKRQVNSEVWRRTGNSTKYRSVFDKYQFFTPGLFMALFATIVLLAILTAGLKALASLEVSVGAFDKEMGPAAQKKPM